MKKMHRRSFLTTGIVGVAGTAVPAPGKETPPAAVRAPRFRLGLVTYELGKNWDIDTLIQNCMAAGFEAAELRTTHRHGVEISLSKDQRVEVRKKFADSPVRLLSLGTTCDYHSPDRAVVDRNIEETKRWCELAHDLGCLGIKVRPNALPQDVPEEKTISQIGNALERCGDAARANGVEIWLEVHGDARIQEPLRIQRIMELAHHPSVGICWNSNDADVTRGSVAESFQVLRPWLRHCHLHELWNTTSPWGGQPALPPKETRGSLGYANPYPYSELFRLLRESGYDRYTLAEVPESPEPIRFMRYYRALWEALM